MKFSEWVNKIMNMTPAQDAPAAAQEVQQSTGAGADTATMDSEKLVEWLGLDVEQKTRPANEATYFTCLKMMSETIAKMPWKIYRQTENGVIEAEKDDVYRVLKIRPNPFMTPTMFWNAVELNRCHYGNGYVYIQRTFSRKKYGGEIKLLNLWVMPADSVKVIIDDQGIFAGKGRIWYVYQDRYSAEQYVFNSDDVIHLKTSYSFDGITGLPVQTILKTTIEGAGAAQDFMNKLYRNGLTAKAVLEYTGDMNREAQEKLIKAFETFGAGTKNTGKILPVPLGMKLTPLDIKLSDAQFIEIKKYSALQIAGAFGIKPNQINDYEKSSYSNSEMQQLSFYVDTALFPLKQYEEEVSYKLLSQEAQDAGTYCKLNEKVLLRTDSKTQMEVMSKAVNNGIYKPNEARRKLDMVNADGGDQLIVNGNYIPLSMVGQQYTDGPGAGTQTAQDAPDGGGDNDPPDDGNGDGGGE